MKATKREHYCKGEFCEVKTIWHRELTWNDDGEIKPVWVCGNCGREEEVVERKARASRIPGYQTPSQKRAIEFLRNHISGDFDEERGEDFVRWETKSNEYDGSLWLMAEVEMVLLPDGNLLKALSRKFWTFWIGRNGKIEAVTYPNSYKQFKGQKVFGRINVK